MPDSSQQPTYLEVSLVPEASCLFLHLRGELDLCSAHEVPREDFASRWDLTTVLVDLGEVTFCDGAGIRALMAFRAIHEAQGRAVTVVRATPFIWRLLRLCGVSDRLSVARPIASV